MGVIAPAEKCSLKLLCARCARNTEHRTVSGGILLLILLRTVRLEGVAGHQRAFLVCAAIGIPWTLLYLAVRRWKRARGLASRVANA